MRNQIHLAYARRSFSNSPHSLVRVLDGTDIEINTFFSKIPSLPSYDYVEKFDKKFKIETAILVKYSDDLPVFGRIHQIYIIEGKVCFILHNCKLLRYDYHKCGYLVD